MSYFKEFCDSIHKTKAGYVPDLLDLESDDLRDLCMTAFIADLNGTYLADRYIKSFDKNDVYSRYESRCQDAIDAYNQTIDDEREAKKLAHEIAVNMFDPNYKYARFNQAEIDAGFSGTGKEFC